jgi:hypothetical protein
MVYHFPLSSSTGLQLVAELSLWTYVLACIGNWAAHAVWLYGEAVAMKITVPIVLYSLMLPNIIQVR